MFLSGSSLRLSFSYVKECEIDAGVALLAHTIKLHREELFI